MIDDILFAPLGAVDTGLVGRFDERGIEHKKVKFVVGEVVEGLRGEFLYSSQVTQLEGQQSHRMLFGII